jgi:membrane protein DedA with SNARE-associated domain
VLASFSDLAAHVGLPVLFLLISIETMGIPVPGETALFTAAIVASRGDLPIEAVIAVAAAAAIVGDNVGFAIGRKLGRRLLTAPGPLYRHRTSVLAAGEPFFERHGPKAVFLGRWITGLRITSAWLAGANRMVWPTFLFYNAAGGIAWATSVALVGFYLGEAGEKAVRVIGLAAAALVVAAGLAVWLLIRTRRRRAEAAPAADRSELGELD